MARPREFDPDEVVRRAADVFRQNGYEQASLPDLLDGMGLTRGSLYKAFGDKKSLFLLVLAHYETVLVDRIVRRLTDPAIPDGRRRINGVFKSIMQSVEAGDRRGCLLCTCLSGPEMSDADIAAVVQTGLRRIRDGFARALAVSPLHAGLSTPKRMLLANTLLAQYVGMQTLTRSCLPLGVVEQSVQAVDAMLLAQQDD